VLALTVVLAAGCTPGATSSGEDDDVTENESPSVTVTIPAARLTPFCQAMIDLNDRLENDPPDDVAAEILDTYEGIVDEVPTVIRADFDAVVADLRGEVPTGEADAATSTSFAPPTSDPLADEGRSPGDTPAERLSSYVDFECRSIENNPGPPATQPLSGPAATEP
jgi:hypothetical protein